MVLKTDFTRSQENAQDDLNGNFEQLAPLLEDTGWVDIQTSNGFSWAHQGQARKIGNKVMMRGTLSSTKALDIAKPFVILPENFRHNYAISYRFNVAAASGLISNVARIYVDQNGEMRVIAQTNTDMNIVLDQINYLVD